MLAGIFFSHCSVEHGSASCRNQARLLQLGRVWSYGVNQALLLRTAGLVTEHSHTTNCLTSLFQGSGVNSQTLEQLTYVRIRMVGLMHSTCIYTVHTNVFVTFYKTWTCQLVLVALWKHSVFLFPSSLPWFSLHLRSGLKRTPFSVD